ncbi:hypothetical protein BDW62DRAFT_175572 [Aspergillus aurantiobrunneus]
MPFQTSPAAAESSVKWARAAVSGSVIVSRVWCHNQVVPYPIRTLNTRSPDKYSSRSGGRPGSERTVSKYEVASSR